MSKDLQSVCVVLQNSEHIGFLYMQNAHVVVLLNDLVSRADLGPLKAIRYECIEPEAHISVIPRKLVRTIISFDTSR